MNIRAQGSGLRRAGQPDVRTAATDPTFVPMSITFVDPHGGDGGFYWLLTVIFPGMESFRFPSKLLTIVCLGLAGLAGMGWDLVVQGRAGRAWWYAVLGLLASLGAIGFLLGGSAALAPTYPTRPGFAPWHLARSTSRASCLTCVPAWCRPW